jgi:hypothetical protein
MLSNLDAAKGPRWPRGQRFALSSTGAEAEASWRTAAQEARSLGRSALDGANRRWADPLGLDPSDGLVLSELRPGKRSIAELVRTLEICGASQDQVRASVGRLVSRGLVEALPPSRPGTVS